jgi:hypothetical protein
MQNKMKNREVGGYREVKMKSLQDSEKYFFLILVESENIKNMIYKRVESYPPSP